MKQFLWVFLALVLYAGRANAYTIQPVDGLWGITEEQNLAIGRAFNIEVSDAIVVITMYAYNASRAPTFYAAAGALDANNRVTATMSEPQGGTCLGCSVTNGRALSTPGVMSFEFTSSTTGFVTLPGEARKAIIKGTITRPAAPAGLLGTWIFNYITNSTAVVFSEAYRLNTIRAPGPYGRGLVTNTEFTVSCEYQTSGSLAGEVFCVRFLGSSATIERSMRLKWFGNLMDGAWYIAGNPAATPNSFAARRMFSISGNENDIKRGETEPLDVTERISAFRDALNSAALTP